MAILGVQATLGYSWTMMGVIAGAFHAGGAAGALLAPGMKGCITTRAQLLSACTAAACAVSGILYEAGIIAPGLFATLLLCLLVPAGAAGGAAFVGAVALLRRRGIGVTGTGAAGTASLAAYAGSMTGALAVPLLLFPLAGGIRAMVAVALAGALSIPFASRVKGAA
jgi:hypothetical protein